MPEITEKEYEMFQTLKKVWVHARVEGIMKGGVYFICDEGGPKDSMGLPEFIFVCPTYGADFRNTARYVRDEPKENE